MSSEDQPRLVELGANTRGAASKKNIDVSGTVGPDYLGQETKDVDGHPCDRPGVRSRLPESGRDHPEISRMDTGEELPVLLSSSMRTDPIEATQGSYTQIVEGECPRCGYDRLVETVVTMAGECHRTCNACGAKERSSADDGYTMPKTDKERAKEVKEAGEKIGSLKHNGAIIDLEDHTGWGPMISIVDSRSKHSLWKEEVEELFWTLVENDDIDLWKSIESNTDHLDRVEIILELREMYDLSLEPKEDSEDTEDDQ